MTRDEAADLISSVLASWVQDAENDAVWTGCYRGRIGLRVSQSVRDYTTIWFDVGERTVAAAAFLLPHPVQNPAETYRLCLVRNQTSWPAYIAIDNERALHILARRQTASFSVAALETLVGAIYEVVELSFPALVRTGFGKREKTS